MNFTKTLELHLKAMKEKDYHTFISTVKLEDVMVIMPNGSLVKGKADFINLHKSWFKDEDWRINYEIIMINEKSELAYSLIDIDYEDCDEKGNPIHMQYYLNLIFEKYNNEWLLVHDQNTIHE